MLTRNSSIRPLPTKLPLVGGHEGAGIVVAKGDLVTDVEIGDHAGIKVCNKHNLDDQWLTQFVQWLNGSCLACDFCQTGDEPLCQKALLSGYTVDGTFQEYAIGKAAHVAKIPKDVPLDAIAPVLCAGVRELLSSTCIALPNQTPRQSSELLLNLTSNVSSLG